MTECLDPGTLENGVSLGNVPFMCHSQVTFSCNEGFLMSGESLMTCAENGQWNGNKPKCIAKGKQLICFLSRCFFLQFLCRKYVMILFLMN